MEVASTLTEEKLQRSESQSNIALPKLNMSQKYPQGPSLALSKNNTYQERLWHDDPQSGEEDK